MNDVQSPEDAATHTEPRTVYGIEIQWRDWRKAGAKRPTSELGDFASIETRDKCLEWVLREREIVAYRLLERVVVTPPWAGPPTLTPITEEMREQAFQRVMDAMPGGRNYRDGMGSPE